MISPIAIRKFQHHEGPITVSEGISIYQGHIQIVYPEYKGDKDGMLKFYQAWAKRNNINKPKLNNVLHHLMYFIIYK